MDLGGGSDFRRDANGPRVSTTCHVRNPLVCPRGAECFLFSDGPVGQSWAFPRILNRRANCPSANSCAVQRSATAVGVPVATAGNGPRLDTNLSR